MIRHSLGNWKIHSSDNFCSLLLDPFQDFLFEKGSSKIFCTGSSDQDFVSTFVTLLGLLSLTSNFVLPGPYIYPRQKGTQTHLVFGKSKISQIVQNYSQDSNIQLSRIPDSLGNEVKVTNLCSFQILSISLSRQSMSSLFSEQCRSSYMTYF